MMENKEKWSKQLQLFLKNMLRAIPGKSHLLCLAKIQISF